MKDLALIYLNTYFSVEDDKLFFDGYVTPVTFEYKSIARQFLMVESDAQTLLLDWCTEREMTEAGWIASTLTAVKLPLQAGYIWAPYVPLQQTEQILEDPNEFEPRRGLVSRYARTQVDNRFYGTINITNLP